MFFRLKLAVFLAIGYILLTGPSEAGTGAGTGAGTARLTTLLTGDQGRGWEGVGRLNIGDSAFCTGALVAEDLVLTAAHCLFDPASGARIAPDRLEFLAGWRGGRASARRGVRRAVVHPDYRPLDANMERRVRNDLALLQLERPIRSASIRPFAVHEQPRKGASVGVVSYGVERADSPALEQGCKVLARQSGTLVLSCQVDFGSSGAPVFVMQDGRPEIVSVVSAKAHARDMPVSLGTALAQPLEQLMAMMAASNGMFEQARPAVRILRPATDTRASIGAKFVRP